MKNSATVWTGGDTVTGIELVHGDALDYLNMMIEERIVAKAIFMDPPDNIDLTYDGYKDTMLPEQYYNWIELLLTKAMMTRVGVVWLSYYHAHDLEIKTIVRRLLRFRHPTWAARTFIWRFTFGQYTDKDCASGYRPILRLVAPGCVLYPDKIKVVSERARLGDLRAAIDGMRVPDDVWEFPRIVGNFAERRSWHPTQHPEGLMEQIIKFSCSEYGTERFVDLFSGSGTSLRACWKTGIPCTAIEQSLLYCKKTAEDQGLVMVGPPATGEQNDGS